MLFFLITSISSLQNSWYHELMHINASLLSYVSDHLFLHDSWLIFKIDYEIIFSNLKDLLRSIFELRLRSKRWVIHKEIFLNIVYSNRATMNLFSNCQKMLWVYQDWLELVNDLVEIWSKSDSDLTQIWLNILFLSQHSFLSSTSCSSTSFSFHVTNISLSSLMQSLNIT